MEITGPPDARHPSTTSWIRCARSVSPMPENRSVLSETSTGPRSPAIAGITCRASIASISPGTPGKAKTLVPRCSSSIPGAVPIGLAMARLPCGKYA